MSLAYLKFLIHEKMFILIITFLMYLFNVNILLYYYIHYIGENPLVNLSVGVAFYVQTPWIQSVELDHTVKVCC